MAGEDFAVNYLKNRGFKIKERNFRTRWGEIDIVAQKGEHTHFVEVKTRTSDLFGPPEESITRRKRQSIERAIVTYVRRHPEVKQVRFDVVAVFLPPDGTRTLKHFRAVGGSLAFL